MKQKQLLGPRVVIKVPTSLTRIPQLDSSILIESKLQQTQHHPNKKELVQRVQRTASIHARLFAAPSTDHLQSKHHIESNDKKNVSSQSKLSEIGKATYRIKSTSKLRVTSRGQPPSSNQQVRTIQSRMQTVRSKKQLVDLLGRRLQDNKSKTTSVLLRNKPPVQHTQEDSIVQSNKNNSRLKSEMTIMLTQEEQDLEFQEYGFRTNRELYKYDLGSLTDQSPQDIIRRYNNVPAPHGVCPSYKDGKYVWTEVKLIGYSSEDNKFVVMIMDSRQVKKISRLSVVFRHDNLEKFKKRIRFAKAMQQVAMEELRFQAYVGNLPMSMISQMPVTIKQNIIDMTKRKIQPLAHKNLLEEMESVFNNFNKKYHVLDQMKTNPEKYEKIRLLPRKIQFESPQPEKRFAGFKETKEAIKNKHYSQFGKFAQSLGHVIEKSQYLRDFFPFAKPTTLLKLKQFELLQTETVSQNFYTLRKKWRDFLAAEIHHTLRKTFDLYSTDQQYLQKISVHIRLHSQMFEDLVRSELHEGNIKKWEMYLESFYEPLPGEQSKYSYHPLPILDLKMLVTLPEKEKKRKDRPASGLKKQIKDCLHVVPTKEQFHNGLLLPILQLQKRIRETPCLEEDIFQTKKFNKYLQAEHISSSLIDNLVDRTFEPIELFIENMRDFYYLLEEPHFDKLPFEQKTLDICSKTLQNLQNSRQQIMRTFLPDYHMVRVDLSELKTVMMQRIVIHKQYLLKKIENILKDEIKKLEKQFVEIRQVLDKLPTNEEMLVELKAYTLKMDTVLEEIERTYKLQGNFFSFLQSNFYNFDMDRMQQWFLLVKSPVQVKLQLGEVRNTLKSQEMKFIEAINDDRETFMTTVDNIKMDLKEVQTYGPYSNANKLYQQAAQINYQLEAMTQKLANINHRQRLLKQSESIYEPLPKMIKNFQPYHQLWLIASNFQLDKEDWTSKSILSLNYDLIEKKMTSDYQREILRLLKYFTNIKNIVAHGVCEEAKKAMEKFREKLWLIENLTCEGLIKKPGLFKQMFVSAGIPFIQLKEMSLQAVCQAGLDQHRQIVEQSSRKAQKIWGIEKKINEINDTLKGLELQLIPFQKTDTHIVNGFDDMLVLLDDQFNLLTMLKASPYIKGVMNKTNTIEGKIVLVRETLEIMIKCQTAWMYLQPIFSSGDIEKQMPLQSQKFAGVDKTWRSQMDYFNKDSQVWDSIESETHKNRLESAHTILQEIQKELTRYLESKRKLFPRFYFLSDDELIEILSQTKDPLVINKHISKCFEAIHFLRFQGSKIKSIRSQEGEQISLLSSIDVETPENKGNVEVWLKDIQYQMRQSVRQVVLSALRDKTPRGKWILKWPAMVVLSANMTRWTQLTQEAIKNLTVEQHFNLLTQQLKEVVQLVRQDLNLLERMTLQALVVIDVHNKDVVERLLSRQKTITISDFVWSSQLRYYLEELPYKRATRPDIMVRMINAKINYCYEYLGNTTRLVITPLTDRCYRTLMGAIDLNYGGAPEGPAGTGKTETVKDLAKALAVQCVVFNCSDGLNYLAMTKFFKGLASAGAWCCFDQFNRIDLEVLSVIAQQVLTIQNAIKEKRKVFIFDGQDTVLVRSCAINITMNPGYAGRSELPDNLKALFRPCAMMVPDYSLIGEIYLYSVGFQEARELSKKIVASLKLSSEQLSSQDHYDFGMRALKSILTAAGTLKRTSTEPEKIICLRALLDVNMPKFTEKDMPLFSAITSDLFPGLKLPEGGQEVLWAQLRKIAVSEQLDIRLWGQKVEQLWAIIKVRHGVMLVGQTLSGKTVAANTLCKILSTGQQADFKPTDILRLNPKSITTDSLYGRLDPISKSWSDGVLPLLMRKCISQQDGHYKWITFDGPVDAVWIQNMNTVLDDNKKLCLTSGQIIKLINGMTMMFEVQDLSQASPATVSRCGMVYLETGMLGWQALIHNMKVSEVYAPLSSHIIEQSIKQIKHFFSFPNLKYIVVAEDMILVGCFRRLLQANLQENEKKKKQPTKEILNNIIFFTLVWSLAATLTEQSRTKISPHMVKILEDNKIPGGIYDYVYSLDRYQWLEWVAVEAKFRLPTTNDVPFHTLIIPTKDTLRNGYLFRLSINNNRNILFYGPTGTSKSSTVQANLKHYHNEHATYLQTSFSGRTTAKQIQTLIELKMTTRKRHNVFAPEQNKQHLIVFIDELNMPVKEKYGCQPPLELLRQMIEMTGCYDLETKEFKLLTGMVWVGAMLPVKVITPRLLRHFQLIYVPAFEKESLVLVFTSILQWFFTTVLNPFSKDIRNLGQKLIQGSIKLFHSVQECKQLLPTPDKSHYVFNMRDMSKIFQGLVRVNGKTIENQIDLLRLWVHQCRRVFQDRMINNEDKKKYDELAEDILERVFRRSDPAIMKEPCFYTQIVDGDYRYQTLESIKNTLNDALADYNSTYRNLNMVLFTSAVEHIVRAVRILSTEGSHMLLIGVGGSGRKSVTKLATYLCFSVQAILFEQSWDEEVLQMVRTAGVEDRPTTFIVDDRQVTKEDTFEDISNLLNRSEIPRLLVGEEKAKLLDEIQIQGTPIEKYQDFLKKCKKNLHVVVCMSPLGTQFRKRLRLFPSLVNCTSIDWYSSWPQQALKETSVSCLKTLEIDKKKQVIEVCVGMHQHILDMTNRYRIQQRKYCYVTPTNFLELLSTFTRLHNERKEKLKKDIHKYESGVLKIDQTEKEVARMKGYLEQLKPKLENSKKQNQVLLVNLKASQAEADVKRKNCENQEKQCNKQRAEATRLKDECQTELNKVLPLLQNAAETLQKISKDDMVQLRSFLSPPLSAASVMEGMCYVFNEDQHIKAKMIDGEKVQDFWEYSKKNILNDKLIKRVKEFKVDQVRAIPPVKIEKLKIFFQKPQFEKQRVFNASKAAGNLSLWIRAVVDTYDALLVVDPKKHLLYLAQKQLTQSEMLLRQKQQALNAVLAVLQQLEDHYEKARKQKQQLEAKVNKVKTQLERAEKLTLGLSSGKQQWKKRAEALHLGGITIIGDSLLAAGIINYLGPFPLSYREETIQKWKQSVSKHSIAISSPFNFQQLFGDMLVISEWTNIMKLPNDPVSIDNAIIMKKSRRFPLLIDPQDQALIWIRNLQANRKLITLKPSMPQQQVMFKIETYLQLGLPILLENVKDISNIYTPLLEKEINNGRLRYGDKWFQYSDDFMFYMTTKDDNQHFAPETCMLVTLLNFSITRIGLTNQLQNMLLTSLHPIQSQNLNNAYIEISSLSHKLLETERLILELLEKTQDILGDDTLIQTLEKSKIESIEVQERLKKCEQTKKDIEVIRKNLYSQADIYSSWYFVTEWFVFIESVYKWSLDGFKSLLQKVLGTSRDLHVINKTFFDLYFHYINRSLFEKDKLQFVLLIAINGLLREKKIRQSEVRLMMVGPVATTQRKNTLSELSNSQWSALCQLEEQCQALKNVAGNEKLVRKLMESGKPATEVQFQGNLFYLLLLIRFLRPQKFIESVYELIRKEVGDKYLESPPFNLKAAFLETKNNIPLLFLMTTGADPRLEIMNLAEQQGNRKVMAVSLGQGQKKFALDSIAVAMKEGEWVLLQNCHLSPSFMPQLEKLFENFPQSVSDSFRLFLTSMPTDIFPVNVLTNATKITFEPPGSLKNTLLRLFGSVHPKEFQQAIPSIKTILFNLSFFHSILLERRRYGPVGWNIPYEFTISDFQISLSAIGQFMAQSQEPWQMVNYMVGEAYYGGRVTDPMDRRLLVTLLQKFMNSQAILDGHMLQQRYEVPLDHTIQSYVGVVNGYSVVQPTQVFGLNPNAQITSQILKTGEICGSILSILPQESEGGRPILVVLEDILKKMPEKPASDQISKHPIRYEQSINTVLHQQLERYLKLYNRIQKDMSELIQGQKGEIQITAAHEEILRSIAENRVPRGWGQGKLAAWLELFNTQIKFLNNWLRNGQPRSFLMPCFIFPQGFFTAILQNYSRTHQLPVDQLRFEFKVINDAKSEKDLKEIPQCCYIHGLILQAGSWSRKNNCIEEQQPKQLYCPMPYILVKPTEKQRIVSDNFYECPVYKNSERRGVLSTTGHSSNFIMSIDLPTRVHPSHWILRGVAMIASL